MKNIFKKNIGKDGVIIEGENDDMIIMGCNLIYGVNYKMGKI